MVAINQKTLILRVELKQKTLIKMPPFSDPIKPINSIEENPIKVSPIDANKSKTPFEKEEDEKKELPFVAAFLMVMKNLLGKLILEEDHLFSSFEKESLAYHLQALATLFNQLKAVDLNPEITFYHALSTLWQKLLQSIKIAKQMGVKTDVNIEEAEELVTNIEQFPPGEGKKLGYYLKEPPEGNWHPMPFREMIQQLYSDHLQNSAGSILSEWVQTINKLITTYE